MDGVDGAPREAALTRLRGRWVAALVIGFFASVLGYVAGPSVWSYFHFSPTTVSGISTRHAIDVASAYESASYACDRALMASLEVARDPDPATASWQCTARAAPEGFSVSVDFDSWDIKTIGVAPTPSARAMSATAQLEGSGVDVILRRTPSGWRVEDVAV